MGDDVAYPEEYDDTPKMPQDRAEKVRQFDWIIKKINAVFQGLISE